MLAELAVSNLGVIDELTLLLGPRMTAVTGETGAGKTLITDAIALLVGAKAEASVVRPGTAEAEVNGRFVTPEAEFVAQRIVPSEGRSRGYVDGRPASLAVLGDRCGSLVDVHGQHLHQSLARGAAQRSALDRFAEIDLAPLVASRAERREIERRLDELGGDETARARELDLLRFQLAEVAEAAIEGAEEEARLEEEEAHLAGAEEARVAAYAAAELLSSDGAAGEATAAALAALSGHDSLGAHFDRLASVLEDFSDVASGLRYTAEALEASPERLAEVVERRQLIADLKRKYGPTLADVISFADAASTRLEELEAHDEVAAALGADLDRARAAEAAAASEIGALRRAAAPRLAAAVEAHLAELALPNARVEVAVGADPGDAVEFRLSVNSGAPLLPLARVASGGELSRAMLALQLVCSSAPPTVVFDEVDAGVGGEAAIAVGRALARLAESHQVLVVTHLPQVAAFADQHIRVSKRDDGESTSVSVDLLDDDARVVEISRMLSGSPDSSTAQLHAEELLTMATRAVS